MREIKFRAKRKLNGDWVFGSLVKSDGEDWDCIVTEYFGDLIDADNVRVITNTIGQFTGLKDKNGKEIYESDLVLRSKSIVTDSRPYEVFFAEVRCSFALTRKEKNFNSYDDIVKCKWSENDKYHIVCPDGDRDESLEVIGNIYENPELLK